MKQDDSLPRRSFAKALSWETFSTAVLFFLSWMWFGHVGMCASFAAFTFVIKLVLFYAHERVWHQIPYGKRR